MKGDDKGILESDGGIFCSFCLITQGKGQSQKKKKKLELKCPSTKLIEGTGFFSLCCIIMGTSEGKSLLSKRKKFMYLCSQKRSIAGENIFQPSTCVPVSTEKAQDTLRRQQKELLQPLTKVALPRFMQKQIWCPDPQENCWWCPPGW